MNTLAATMHVIVASDEFEIKESCGTEGTSIHAICVPQLYYSILGFKFWKVNTRNGS